MYWYNRIDGYVMLSLSVQACACVKETMGKCEKTNLGRPAFNERLSGQIIHDKNCSHGPVVKSLGPQQGLFGG